MRLWLDPENDLPPLEHCGEKTSADVWQYVTQGPSAKLSFTSADKAIGATVSILKLPTECFRKVHLIDISGI